mmetsp:Transcript_1040/g.2219  ORF Transcript_1040/g.2219 Transcript_1040/m.2219 type:complete len:205 (+) Transcript_1040:250-864(+)
MSRVVKMYLGGYNILMTLGWTYVLARLIKAWALGRGPGDVFSSFENALSIFQTGAVLEVLHAMFGLVRSSWQSTFLQVSSRIYVVWAALYLIPSVRGLWAVSTMILAWALTEVPRYLYFSVMSQGSPPRWLTWLRYSTFFILYPLGAGSEMAVLYSCLSHLKSQPLLSLDLASLRLSFNVYRNTILALLAYIPVSSVCPTDRLL